MQKHLDPSQRQTLIHAIESYIAQHYSTRNLPAFSKNEVEQNVSDASATNHLAAAAPLPAFPAPSTSQHADDDWDILERIFSTKKSVKSSAKPSTDACNVSIHDLIEEAENEETFSEALLRVIQEKQLTEPEVYNSVFMDRKLFNKIRNTPEYQPSKRTALLLAIALKLDLEQTRAFIGKAGFQLVHWNKFDIIIEYFIVNGKYNVFEINEMLAEFKMPLLLRCD